MKLVRFIPKCLGIPPRIGVLQKNIVVDLAASFRAYLYARNLSSKEGAYRLADTLLPGKMLEFIENGPLSMEAAHNALQFIKEEGETNVLGEKTTFQDDEVQLLSPIEKSYSLRDFLSFELHLKNARARRGKEVPSVWYEIPIYYKGNVSSIVGPEDAIEWPSYSNFMDYELEMACIIGKSGKNISKEEAEDHIFGYTIMNDFSARDMQFKETEGGLGPAKGKDFATAFGPYIITKDELPDPYHLRMTAKINGELWSDGNSNSMYRKFTDMIAYASQDENISAGDIFGSGTVGNGCGLELGKQLKDGDIIELEIEHLGVLKNQVFTKK